MAAQQNVTPNKRKYDNNGPSTNDDENEAIGEDGAGGYAESTQNGEGSSSTSTSSDTVPKKKRRKEFLNLNATFMAGIQGVSLVTDQVSVYKSHIAIFIFVALLFNNIYLFTAFISPD